MDLVEYDQAVLVIPQEQRRFGQPGAVFPRLQVKIQRCSLFGDGQCERRLTDLARPDQGDRGLSRQGLSNNSGGTTRYHPCILSTL